MIEETVPETSIAERLSALEVESRKLEPAGPERQQYQKLVLNYTEDFLDKVNDLKAYNKDEKMGSDLLNSPISEEPGELTELISLVEKNVDYPSLNPASGGHLGYIPGGGIYVSALGDYMADVTNRYAGVFFGSPGAVRMENMLLDWMASLVGWKQGYAGNLTSGGSMANLISIVTARDAMGIKSKDVPKAVIYATQQAHHSLLKAIRVAGLSECIVRMVEVDERHRMSVSDLETKIAQDRVNGLKPFLIIASAGTTDIGTVDPLDAIGDTAHNHKLWFHVDGAYGAFFLLADSVKEKLKGMSKADSVIMDPHKGLFLPYGTGAVLVKDKEQLRKSHYYLANYMQDTVGANDELSPADLSPELTKHFRGMRLWLPLKLHGVKPFRACLEEKIWLTRYFYEEIQKLKGFEVGPYPELSVATFRYLPENGDANEFNKKLVNAIHEDGRVFLSSTTINGQIIIRLAVLSFRTHKSTIDLTLQVLKEKSEELSEQLS